MSGLVDDSRTALGACRAERRRDVRVSGSPCAPVVPSSSEVSA